jgi:hypothetical protein
VGLRGSDPQGWTRGEWMFSALFLMLIAAEGPPIEDVVSFFVGNPADVAEAAGYIRNQSRKSGQALAVEYGEDPAAVTNLIQNLIARNLLDKIAISTPSNRFPLTKQQVMRQVADFEIFRLETFIRSGVFPRRYFGYFDEIWDTAKYETRLRKAIHKATKVANDYLEQTGESIRHTEMELAVFYVSEGGAVRMLYFQENIENNDPWLHGGLQDLIRYVEALPNLLNQLERVIESDIRSAVSRPAGRMVEGRNLYFDEVIVGSALRYTYMKLHAQKRYRERHGLAIERLPFTEQLIATRSYQEIGPRDSRELLQEMLHDEVFTSDQFRMVQNLEGASRLRELALTQAASSEKIVVFGPKENLSRMLKERMYPFQPAEWWGTARHSTIYNVLMTYGGMVALTKFSDLFDEAGRFRRRDTPQGAVSERGSGLYPSAQRSP